MKLPCLLPLIAALTVSGHAASPPSFADEHARLDQQSAELRAAATAFCTELHRERISGLPTAEQLQRLSPLITPELKAIFERAGALQQQMMRKHPDEKPMWTEGDMFSSLFESVTGWEVKSVFNAPTVDGTAKIKQHYVEPAQKPVTWTDTLIFKRRDDRWLLNDIRMGCEWAFKSGVSLRGALPGGGHEREDHDSLDEHWHIAFTRGDKGVTKIAIEPKDHSFKPQVLFGGDAARPCPAPTWVVWNADCTMLSLRLGERSRFTRTLVFRLEGHQWQPLELPVIHDQERKTMLANGFTERETLIDADHWQDSNTLVVKYFTSFANADDGDGYHEFVSVRFGAHEKAAIVEALDMPGQD